MLYKMEKWICMVIEVSIGIILFVLVGINVLQVVTRYFVAVTITWVEDLSVIGIQWIAALGVPLAWFRKTHLEMDITDKIYSASVKKILWWFMQVVCVFAAIQLISMGLYTMKLNMGFVASAVGYDESLRYVPLVLCGGLLTLAAVFKIVEELENYRSKSVKAHAGR